jgi:hypothetical protein
MNTIPHVELADRPADARPLFYARSAGRVVTTDEQDTLTGDGAPDTATDDAWPPGNARPGVPAIGMTYFDTAASRMYVFGAARRWVLVQGSGDGAAAPQLRSAYKLHDTPFDMVAGPASEAAYTIFPIEPVTFTLSKPRMVRCTFRLFYRVTFTGPPDEQSLYILNVNLHANEERLEPFWEDNRLLSGGYEDRSFVVEKYIDLPAGTHSLTAGYYALTSGYLAFKATAIHMSASWVAMSTDAGEAW